MTIKDANINIQPMLTKEQIAYEDAMKNVKYATARLKISQEGLKSDNLSQNQLDDVIKLFDEMDTIHRDFNIEAQKLQQDSNTKIKTLQEDANKKLTDIQGKYRVLIEIMKTGAKGDYNIKDIDITMSKEREEEIKKELADALAKSKPT